jgi:signal peptidase I
MASGPRKRLYMTLLRNLIARGRRPGPHGVLAEWTITLSILFFATTTLVQAYVIPTGSMENTILIGDHVLVDKLAYADPGAIGKHLLPYRDVRRGDIIVFRYPPDGKTPYVKRAIGLAGDRIHLDHGQVVRNGQRLIEPYTRHIAPGANFYGDNFPQSPDAGLPERGREMLANHEQNGEIVVPPDSFFALGDNRDNSLDSRFWGFVPRENLIGKPLVVYWSYDAPSEDLLEWNVRHLSDVALHFFTRTRWDRTFLLPRPQPAEVH